MEALSSKVRGPVGPVVLVSHGFQTNYERGFANAVASLGVDVVLISSDRTDTSGLDPRVRVRNLRGSQEERRSRAEKARNQLRYIARLLAFVARQPRGTTVHVIGLIEPPLLFGLGLGLAFRLLAGHYVLTVHNLLPHDRHTAWQRRWFGLAFRIPQVLVVHTKAMGARLAGEFGVAPKRIVHMEHGLEPFPAPLAPNPSGGEPLRLLFFGVLKTYKGLDLLLTALEAVHFAWCLEIHGICTSDALAADIEARILTHPRRADIDWQRRFVPEDEVPALFARVDALVLPYRAIDQSGVLFQALRFGVPVVASRVGSFGEYVAPQVGELCDPNDVPSLAAAIERLQARRATLGRAAIRDYGRRYEWSETVRPLGAVYGG